MSSITYSERIKIETFCELGLSNIQMGVRINFKIYPFKKFKLQKYPSYTDSEAKDAAKAFRKLIEQNA